MGLRKKIFRSKKRSPLRPSGLSSSSAWFQSSSGLSFNPAQLEAEPEPAKAVAVDRRPRWERVSEGDQLQVWWASEEDYMECTMIGCSAVQIDDDDGARFVYTHRCLYPGGVIEHDLSRVDFMFVDSEKEAQVVADSMPPPTAATQGHNENQPADDDSDDGLSPDAPTPAKPLHELPAWERLREGDKLRVWWESEEEYVECTMVEWTVVQHGHYSIYTHSCLYEGGIIEHDLSKIHFEVLPAKSPRAKAKEEKVLAGARTRARVARAREHKAMREQRVAAAATTAALAQEEPTPTPTPCKTRTPSDSLEVVAVNSSSSSSSPPPSAAPQAAGSPGVDEVTDAADEGAWLKAVAEAAKAAMDVMHLETEEIEETEEATELVAAAVQAQVEGKAKVEAEWTAGVEDEAAKKAKAVAEAKEMASIHPSPIASIPLRSPRSMQIAKMEEEAAASTAAEEEAEEEAEKLPCLERRLERLKYQPVLAVVGIEADGEDAMAEVEEPLAAPSALAPSAVVEETSPQVEVDLKRERAAALLQAATRGRQSRARWLPEPADSLDGSEELNAVPVSAPSAPEGGSIQLCDGLRELWATGHAANARSDFAAARLNFQAAYELFGRRVEAQLSAANMALKLGEIELAAFEYNQLLLRQDLPSFMRARVVQKLLSVSLTLKRRELEASRPWHERIMPLDASTLVTNLSSVTPQADLDLPPSALRLSPIHTLVAEPSTASLPEAVVIGHYTGAGASVASAPSSPDASDASDASTAELELPMLMEMPIDMNAMVAVSPSSSASISPTTVCSPTFERIKAPKTHRRATDDLELSKLVRTLPRLTPPTQRMPIVACALLLIVASLFAMLDFSDVANRASGAYARCDHRSALAAAAVEAEATKGRLKGIRQLTQVVQRRCKTWPCDLRRTLIEPPAPIVPKAHKDSAYGMAGCVLAEVAGYGSA